MTDTYDTITPTIKSISISGFKSIRQLEDFEMKNLNILIGANGAGKSNLIEAINMLGLSVSGILDGIYLKERGGAANYLYKGRDDYLSKEIDITFRFNEPEASPHTLLLRPTHECDLALDKSGATVGVAASHVEESEPKVSYEVCLYDFRDPYFLAPLRTYEIIEDHRGYLRPNGRNIAPLLLRLRKTHPFYYKQIVDTIRVVAPFFEDFLLDIEQFGPAEKVRLSWKKKHSNHSFQPYHLSDGLIRLIGLTTALIQPNPPKIMLIDEPELGINPQEIPILAEMLEVAAQKSQLIISTQSPDLINHFSINDIIVAKRNDGQSTFERLNEADYSGWLEEEYSIGNLWGKNVIQGGSTHE